MHWFLVVLDIAIAAGAAGHALLNKRDPRAVTGWIAVCFLTPFIGSILYFTLGVNRVQTRARRLATNSPLQSVRARGAQSGVDVPQQLTGSAKEFARIATVITGRSVTAGNSLDCLYNGEQAYPAMLRAIDNAEGKIYLTTYIFECKQTGQSFINALVRARQRGVDVRVIIDGVGELTGFPRASTRLLKKGVAVGRFIPPTLIPPALYINLRNHRKILVVDSKLAFTGGMNISKNHLAAAHDNPARVTDVHFRLTGPIVLQIEQVFLEDWGFATGEALPDTPTANPSEHDTGDAFCRAIADGPNEHLEQLERVLVAIICSAKKRVGIMTPYFLPSRDLMAALRAAALRGVEVSVILPGKSDHAIVQWAARNILHLLLRDGARVYYQPAPFCHSKLLMVDDCYSLIGSANLDPRSLRLNFELGVEVLQQNFCEELWTHLEQVRAKSSLITIIQLEQRTLSEKLRDALAWTCSPYL